MTRNEYSSQNEDWYPSARVAQSLRRKWATPIVYVLLVEESLSFNSLNREVGVDPNTLSQTLEHLKEEGFISRVNNESGIEYELTESGRSLEPVIESMEEFYNQYEL